MYSTMIDKELREEREKYGVKWDEEIEDFVRRRTQELKKQEAQKEIEETLSTMPETKSDSAGMVRGV